MRDLPVAAARGADGGTTVAATALLAHRAGIGVFATGGLGGVHRGASTTFDESADLVALAGVPILVVSAGVKSILDVPATLERLETLNVTVLGYRTDAFPGFYVRDSGVAGARPGREPARRSRPSSGPATRWTCARRWCSRTRSRRRPSSTPTSTVRCWTRPSPRPPTRGVVGHDTTPFLLDHMRRSTEDRSLEVNVAVYRGNVSLGAEVARALAAGEG